MIRELSEDMKTRIQGLYTFPNAPVLVGFLMSKALGRLADYIEVCLNTTNQIQVEVRDNGKGASREEVLESRDFLLLTGLGEVTVVTNLGSDKSASAINLNARTTRSSSQLRKRGQIVSISNLYHSFPPREREILRQTDLVSSLNFAIIQFGLIHTDVRIRVWVNSRLVLKLEKQADLAERAREVLGGNDYRCVSMRRANISISGVISGICGGDYRHKQYLYVNQCPASSPALIDMINSHFLSVFMGKSTFQQDFPLENALKTCPSFIFNIETSPEMPILKSEVGIILLDLDYCQLLEAENMIHELLRTEFGVKIKCGNELNLKRRHPSILSTGKQYTFHPDLTDKQLIEAIEREEDNLEVKKPKTILKEINGKRNEKSSNSISDFAEEACNRPRCEKIESCLPNELKGFRKFHSSAFPEILQKTKTAFRISTSDFAKCQYIGQFDNKCLLASFSTENHLLILGFDQHAADERVNLEQLEGEIWSLVSDIGVNESVTVSSVDLENIRKADKELRKWHFSFTFLEHDSIVHISKLPQVCGVSIGPEAFLSFALELQVSGIPETVVQCDLHRILRSKACKQAIKFGDQVEKERAVDLIARLGKCALGLICAHGRPTVHILSASPLDSNPAAIPAPHLRLFN